DFGFLVPTPSVPALGEVDETIFKDLEKWTAPPVIIRKVKRPPLPAPGGEKKSVEKSKDGVVVLGRERVAGLDAAILKATETKALQGWLKKHGYSTRPALDSWLERYVKDGWIITAFKIANKEPGGTGVSTKALKMTFHTNRPFYPYREPEDMRAAKAGVARQLRVFLVSDVRMEGVLGAHGGAWPGRAVWANALDLTQR